MLAAIQTTTPPQTTTKLRIVKTSRKSRKGTTTTTQPINWKLAMTLLEALKADPKNRNSLLMLAVGFFTGLRISDILKLRWQDILNVESFTTKEKKTSKRRTVTINPAFAKIINQVYAGEPLDFFIIRSTAYNATGENKAISRTAVNKRIKKIFETYGIETDNDSSHVMRKTFGFWIYEKYGKTDDILLKLSKIFNHGSIAMTRAYLGISKRVIANIYLEL